MKTCIFIAIVFAIFYANDRNPFFLAVVILNALAAAAMLAKRFSAKPRAVPSRKIVSQK